MYFKDKASYFHDINMIFQWISKSYAYATQNGFVLVTKIKQRKKLMVNQIFLIKKQNSRQKACTLYYFKAIH